MSHATNYLEGAIGQALLHGEPFPVITQWQIALYTASPHEDGTAGTEVSTVDTGYIRQRLDPGLANWGQRPEQDSEGRTVFYNLSTVQFPTATTLSWGLVSHFGLMNQNNVLCFITPIAEAKAVSAGDLGPAFLPGQLEVVIG